MRPPRVALVATLLLVVAALTGAGLVTMRPAEPLRVTASFTDSAGLFVGNDVSVLGVPVGKVTTIEPAGRTVGVTLALDAEVRIPADVGAVVMQASLVTDRYVELTPAYEHGARLATGDHIDADHTRSPANIDDITSAIDDLVVALDGTTPGGKDVGDLLSTTADALDGRGRRSATGWWPRSRRCARSTARSPTSSRSRRTSMPSSPCCRVATG